MTTDHSALPSVTDIRAQWEGIIDDKKKESTHDIASEISSHSRLHNHKPGVSTETIESPQHVSSKESVTLEDGASDPRPLLKPKPKKPRPVAPPKPTHLSSFSKAAKQDEHPSPLILANTDLATTASPLMETAHLSNIPKLQEPLSASDPSPHESPSKPPVPPPSRSMTPRSQVGSPKAAPNTPPTLPSRPGYTLMHPDHKNTLTLSPRASTDKLDGAGPPPVPPPRSPSMATPLSQKSVSVSRFLSDGNYDHSRQLSFTDLSKEAAHFPENYAPRPKEQQPYSISPASTFTNKHSSSSDSLFGAPLSLPTAAGLNSPAPSLPPRHPMPTGGLTRGISDMDLNAGNQGNHSNPSLALASKIGDDPATGNDAGSSITAFDDAPIEEEDIANDLHGFDNSEVPDSLYPDSSQANRRPPVYEGPLHDIHIKAEVKASAVFENYVALATTTGLTVYNIHDGNKLWTEVFQDTKPTALNFIVQQSRATLWIGLKDGQLWETAIDSGNVLAKQMKAHFGSIIAIESNNEHVWTISEDGKICIWQNGDLSSIPKPFRVSTNFKAFCVSGSTLWIGKNKQVFVYQPSLSNDSAFALTPRPINALHQKPSTVTSTSISGTTSTPKSRGIGEFTCGVCVTSLPDAVFFSHDDGVVSVYSKSRLCVTENITVSIHKICSMIGLRTNLWIGLNTGHILVCDVSQRPWKVLKEWKAHEGAVLTMAGNRTLTINNSLPIVTYGHSSTSAHVWDGLLKRDAIERDMVAHDADYSKFNDITVKIVTWNTGSAKPGKFKGKTSETEFVHQALRDTDRGSEPDIIVFGFQELIELDNRKITAKTVLLKGKKDVEKKVSTSSHISHQYKVWQDCLSNALSREYSGSYQLVQSSNMVGLFTCVFMKDEVSRHRLRGTRSSSIKTGLGGYHGNKGALAVRVLIDDSSICFLNCHLAAGQTGTSSRNKDIETILQARFLDETQNTKYLEKGIFVNGGDGTMIMDHEVVFMSGDMNYRINLFRQLATKMIDEGDFSKLLEQDQLSSQLKKNPEMRLRPFLEPPIEFQPTYKFDVGTNRYDSSGKQRVPAWCDRIFYRGKQRVTPLAYNSLTDVQASDHKPVIGTFKVQVKTVDAKRRDQVYRECVERWEAGLDEWLRYQSNDMGWR